MNQRPYRIQYAQSPDSRCQVCQRANQTIFRGDLAVGKTYYQAGVTSHEIRWRHWDCISKNLAQELARAHPSGADMIGYANLKPADRLKLEDLISRYKRSEVSPSESFEGSRQSSSGGGLLRSVDGDPWGRGASSSFTISNGGLRSQEGSERSETPAIVPSRTPRATSATQASRTGNHLNGTSVVNGKPNSPDLQICQADVRVAEAEVGVAEAVLKLERMKKATLEQDKQAQDSAPNGEEAQLDANRIGIVQGELAVVHAELSLAEAKLKLERARRVLVGRKAPGGDT